MKKILWIMFLGLLICENVNAADCNDCKSEANNGYKDSKKAYYSSDLYNCQYYARKAYKHLSLAKSYASDCDCYKAKSEAYDGYKDAKRAYYSSYLQNCQYYSRKAMKHASSTEGYAKVCN